MMEKMTYVKALESVLSTVEMTEEVREKLEALKAQMEKRASVKSTKPTKAQREAAEFTESVFAALTEEPVRCSTVAETLGETGQRVSAALSKLVKAGRVVKTEGPKHVSLFSVPTEEPATSEEVAE